MEKYKQDLVDHYTDRPVQNSDGTWDAVDGSGNGHFLSYASKELVEAWIDGYDTGARENM